MGMHNRKILFATATFAFLLLNVRYCFSSGGDIRDVFQGALYGSEASSSMIDTTLAAFDKKLTDPLQSLCAGEAGSPSLPGRAKPSIFRTTPEVVNGHLKLPIPVFLPDTSESPSRQTVITWKATFIRGTF